MLTASALVLYMSVGGALHALWIAVRCPKLVPAPPVTKMLHVVVALAVAEYASCRPRSTPT